MEVTFSAQIIPDTFQMFKVDKDMLVKDVIKEVLRTISAQGRQVNISDYRVLVTYQLTLTDPSMENLSSNQVALSEGDRLQDIKFQDGFSILFVKPEETATRLELWIQGKRVKTLDRHETLLGRRDVEQNIEPGFDLTPHLGQYELKVSRRQAHIVEEKGRWMIRLTPDAKSTVFIDEQRLEKGSAYQIDDESVISFGPSLEQPYLRILTKITSD